MAADAGEVWGLELVPEAIADAEANAERNGIANARFFAGSARTGVRPLIEQAGKPDVVVVDPPRAGLSQKIVRRLIECEAKRIVYVSCNPTTLAPNAAQLVEAGYRLERVRPVDMFPQTPHIECVALFERTRPPDAARRRRLMRGFGVAAGLDPEVARPLAARCAELGYDSVWSNDHPGAKGLETLAEFAAAAPEIDLGVAVIALDRTPPEQIAADIERRRPRPGAALARGRRRLLREAADADARGAARAAREAARRAPGAGGDGAEDVRARRRRVRRRLLQLDDARLRRRRPREGRGRRRRGRPRQRRRSSATSAPPSATTPPSASPRRNRSTATSTTATATTSSASASPRERSASPPPTAEAQSPRRLRRLDTIVVRGLASATSRRWPPSPSRRPPAGH